MNVCPLTGLKLSVVANGRAAVHLPDHPGANNRGYVLRSRFLMERKIGRVLTSGEEVHHKNENCLDDSIDNLELISATDHARVHMNLDKMKGGLLKIDYLAVRRLMRKGFGYKRISKNLGHSPAGVKYAIKKIKKFSGMK